jgi:hypothetical protein
MRCAAATRRPDTKLAGAGLAQGVQAVVCLDQPRDRHALCEDPVTLQRDFVSQA